MKYLLLLFLLTACATGYKPPNLDVCVNDAPQHDHCVYIIEGGDFEVDNVGHNYNLHNENESFDQFDKEAVRMSVGSYVMLRSSFLDWCHANPKSCTYPDALKRFTDIENKLWTEDH